MPNDSSIIPCQYVHLRNNYTKKSLICSFLFVQRIMDLIIEPKKKKKQFYDSCIKIQLQIQNSKFKKLRWQKLIAKTQ